MLPAKDFDAAQLILTVNQQPFSRMLCHGTFFQVLETCVKNCGKRFHAIVLSKDYASELVKCIGPKYEPPVILQERVLSLIQVSLLPPLFSFAEHTLFGYV